MLECLALTGTTVSLPPRLREIMEKKAERMHKPEVGEVYTQQIHVFLDMMTDFLCHKNISQLSVTVTKCPTAINTHTQKDLFWHNFRGVCS